MHKHEKPKKPDPPPGKMWCPECQGEGVINAGGQQGSAGPPNWVNCPRCNGEKTIPKEN